MENLSRRNFLKVLGAAGAVTAGIASCAKQEHGTAPDGEIPTDKMTYRDNPTTGDHVSILGFGMMRLPSVDGRSAREGDEEIDQ
ncbi:MAG: twin-arginine translocation signal domain-containing protein, partial [Muribaculaceae bacterium]